MTILSKKENSLGECRESNIFVEKQEKLNFGNKKGAPGYLESLGSKLSSYCEQIEVHFYTDTLHILLRLEYQEVLTQRAGKGKH